MKANKKISLFLILSALTFLLAGCIPPRKPAAVPLQHTEEHLNSRLMSKRFRDAAPGGQTAVDSAIKLAREHTELAEKVAVLQEKNQELTAENRQLKDRTAALEPELKQAKKELNEANDLLIEMRIELNNWKTDILGYRNEMRDADNAQLEALLKIFEILGGEVKTEAPQEQGQGQTTALPKEQSKLQLKEAHISGEPNE